MGLETLGPIQITNNFLEEDRSNEIILQPQPTRDPNDPLVR